MGGWVLDFARLKLTQPSKLSLAGAGAELGNIKIYALVYSRQVDLSFSDHVNIFR